MPMKGKSFVTAASQVLRNWRRPKISTSTSIPVKEEDALKEEGSTLSLFAWFSVLVVIFVSLRGFVIGRLIGGEYRWGPLCFDCFVAILVFVVLQCADKGVTKLLEFVFNGKSKANVFFRKSIRLCIVVLVFGTFLLATVQMHPPKIACVQDPADFGMEYTSHEIRTSDGLVLSAWAIPAMNPARPVVVVTHGLGANKQNFIHVSELIHQLNFNVVAFDFRGHGDSQGHTCTLGVREGEDVKAAFDFAKEQFPGRPVYAWSTSLGAAATLRAAAEYQIFDKLVVDATFSSVENLAKETKFSYLGPFESVAWNISRLWYFAYVGEDIQDYSPWSDIANVRVPVFLIHGTGDSVIPHSESSRLLSSAAEGTTQWLVTGAGHSQSFHHPNYPQRILEFYDKD